MQTGLDPQREKHQSRIFAEPILGLGVKQFARSQVNTYVRDLSGFPRIFQRFSNMVIPIFWGELMLKEPPPLPLALMKFCVNYLPLIDHILPWFFIISGLVLWAFSMRITSFRGDAILSHNLANVRSEAIKLPISDEEK